MSTCIYDMSKQFSPVTDLKRRLTFYLLFSGNQIKKYITLHYKYITLHYKLHYITLCYMPFYLCCQKIKKIKSPPAFLIRELRVKKCILDYKES